MEYRRRILPWLLIALGAVMALSALVMLWHTPNVLQYSVLAPEAGEGNANLNATLDKAQEVWQTHHASFARMALGGVNSGVRISSGTGNAEVNLVGMGEGWLEVYPRFLKSGRRISELELQHGTAVIMLDEGLAVRLFGSELPESASVSLNDVQFKVVGVVRHGGSLFGGRGVGDAVAYDAYIPLKAAVSNNIPLEILTMSAAPKGGAGWGNTFLGAVRQWSDGGTMVDLSKEAMRRTILPRVLLLIIGVYALLGLFIRITDRVMGWFEGFRQALKQHYFREMIPRLVGIVALTLACYGALIGAAWLLLDFSVQPVYTFTEWVPDNFVEWSSITKVFWNLVAESAKLVRIGTRELRVVEFWGGLLRWGLILALLGAALLPKAGIGKRQKKA
jgi:hypothetical protein